MSTLSQSDDFNQERFKQPLAIDRGAPFWSWNGKLERERLLHQLEVFEKMGMGGAHLHPRTGLATEYLGEEFMDHVLACAEHAAARDRHIWLYDEDRWPSGFAGGQVTENKAYRIRHLRLTTEVIQAGEQRKGPVHHGPPQVIAEEDRVELCAWALRFEDGLLLSHRVIKPGDELADDERALYAYREILPSWTWFNDQQYVDTLNPKALRRFIEVTHEKYKEKLGDHLGTTAPAIFTDEPLFKDMEIPLRPVLEHDHFINWTDNLPLTFHEKYQEDLLEIFPKVLFNCVDTSHQRARWRFHQHHTDRFVGAFAAQLGQWCGQYGIALTGHMMEEETLERQTRWVGEVMRSLRHFQLPGIDMLCDQYIPQSAKQAQSISRQMDRPGVMSELYGVTNWDFRFADHKRQGDWQAALGITLRVHHLTWYQMGGEAKRDYPASIGEHSPWWQRYRLVEDHFARVNVALKSGRPLCRVAMIHPIESMWLVYGPASDAEQRQRLEEGFLKTLNWMLDDLIDVDLVSEAVLEDLSEAPTEQGFKVGAMTYDAVVIPPALTLRRHTIQRLSDFIKRGGQVIVLDAPPALIEAEYALEDELQGAEIIPWTRRSLLSSLEAHRECRLRLNTGQGVPALHQIRVLPDGSRLMFLCRHEKENDVHGAQLEIKGEWKVYELSTESGVEFSRVVSYHQDWTQLKIDLPVAQHYLFRLEPGRQKLAEKAIQPQHEIARLPEPVKVELLEDNVLLLDRASWRLDEGDWEDKDELLRVDNKIRAKIGLPNRDGNVAQPWTTMDSTAQHKVSLGFDIDVKHQAMNLRLAMEQLSNAVIRLNGRILKKVPAGEWVDIAFQSIAFPNLEEGKHRLEITWPFHEELGIEPVYLLGDFGVHLAGTSAWLTAPVRKLNWGDMTTQGLPFYGGTVRYYVEADLREASSLKIKHTTAPLVEVSTEGQRWPIWRAPWSVDLNNAAGTTQLIIDCYGNRFNTFGQLHNVDSNLRWWGPQSWRTTGDQWSDAWHPRPSGILVAPAVLGRLHQA